VRGEPEIFLSVLLADIFNIVHTRAPRTTVCRPGARESVPTYSHYTGVTFSPMTGGGSTGRTARPRTATRRRASCHGRVRQELAAGVVLKRASGHRPKPRSFRAQAWHGGPAGRLVISTSLGLRHLAFAAFRALALRCAAVRARARALPPSRAIRLTKRKLAKACVSVCLPFRFRPQGTLRSGVVTSRVRNFFLSCATACGSSARISRAPKAGNKNSSVSQFARLSACGESSFELCPFVKQAARSIVLQEMSSCSRRSRSARCSCHSR
jgi:hypothetical protein